MTGHSGEGVCMKWSGLEEEQRAIVNLMYQVELIALVLFLLYFLVDRMIIIIFLSVMRVQGTRLRVDVDHWLDIHKNESLEWNGWKHVCVLFAVASLFAQILLVRFISCHLSLCELTVTIRNVYTLPCLELRNWTLVYSYKK